LCYFITLDYLDNNNYTVENKKESYKLKDNLNPRFGQLLKSKLSGWLELINTKPPPRKAALSVRQAKLNYLYSNNPI